MKTGVTPNYPSEWQDIIDYWNMIGYTISIGKEDTPQSTLVPFSICQSNCKHSTAIYFTAPIDSTPEEFYLLLSDVVYGLNILK